VGQNGVYAYCDSGSLGIVGSSAFIDASKFVTSGSNFCGVLDGILPATGFISGIVIDARGLIWWEWETASATAPLFSQQLRLVRTLVP
jgi:hypothetical protein